MKKQVLIEEDKLIQKATNVLMENFGSVETIRFLSMPVYKRVESVKRHHEWQKGLSRDIFLDEVFS